MPSPGIYKIYTENGYYHVFNRGNNKQPIFIDNPDYKMFLKFFWDIIKYPYPNTPRNTSDVIPLCYCLMPNHFHFLLKQTSQTGITNLMKRFMIKYVMYLNKRHKLVGHLFQSAFKAKLIDEEPYLLHVSRYIHRNPSSIWSKPLHEYPYSSYGHYLETFSIPNTLLNTDEILSFFKSNTRLALKDYLSYQAFVEDYKNPEEIDLQYQFLG